MNPNLANHIGDFSKVCLLLGYFPTIMDHQSKFRLDKITKGNLGRYFCIFDTILTFRHGLKWKKVKNDKPQMSIVSYSLPAQVFLLCYQQKCKKRVGSFGCFCSKTDKKQNMIYTSVMLVSILSTLIFWEESPRYFLHLIFTHHCLFTF